MNNNDDELIERLTRYLKSTGDGKYDVSQELMNELVKYTYGKYADNEYVIEGDGEKTTKVYSKNTNQSDYIEALTQSLYEQKQEAVRAKPAPVVKILNISNLDKVREQFFCVEEEADKYIFYNNFQDYVEVKRKIYGLTDNEPYVATVLFVNKESKKNDKIVLKGTTVSPIDQVKEQLDRIATYGRA